MRRTLTEPEKKLWWHLRHRLSVDGSHFRRQVAIGPYVVDFCSLSAKLVIEVDGDQHGHARNLAHDAQRTAFLNVNGYKVLRFANREVMTEIDTVLDTILAHLSAGSLPLAGRDEGWGSQSRNSSGSSETRKGDTGA